MKINKTARLQIRCTEEWYQLLKQKADERGQSVSAYVAQCIALGQNVMEGVYREESEE